jgi:hypothetical protein
VEGAIRALVDEGFIAASFEDSRMHRSVAKCVVLAAMTPALYTRRFGGWEESGFLRRFLWCHYVIKNPEVLAEAVQDWKRRELARAGCIPFQPTGNIPSVLKASDRGVIKKLCRYQFGGTIPFQFLCKLTEVLNWHYQTKPTGRGVKKGNAMATIEEFSESLSKTGATITL